MFAEQDLQPCNTLGLAACAQVAVLRDEADIPQLCESLKMAGEGTLPLFILGGGSNLVINAHPRHRVLQVALRGIRLWRETATHWVVEAAAGESWHGFVSHCLSRGWPGLENLALIPGTVGAAPVQNIGAYGLELADCLHSVVAWDLPAARVCELTADDCRFAYRDSLFKRAGPGRWLIVRVRIALPKQWVPRLDYPDLQRRFPVVAPSSNDNSSYPLGSERSGTVTDAPQRLQRPAPDQVFEAICEIRRRKLPDPAQLGNAGSFFKNPIVSMAQAQTLLAQFPDVRIYPQPGGHAKLAAGWLIERAGWKGRRLGPVGMHERQALVLVNYGGATASDVQALARAVQGDVQARFGILLEQEPVCLN